MREMRRQSKADSQESSATPAHGKSPGRTATRQSQSTSLSSSLFESAVHKSTRRQRSRADSKIYEVESDLSPKVSVSPRELDALVRLLGRNLDAFLLHGD
jgi:hypothetical protein